MGFWDAVNQLLESGKKTLDKKVQEEYKKQGKQMKKFADENLSDLSVKELKSLNPDDHRAQKLIKQKIREKEKCTLCNVKGAEYDFCTVCNKKFCKDCLDYTSRCPDCAIDINFSSDK